MKVFYCSNKLGNMMEGAMVDKIEIKKSNIHLHLVVYMKGRIITTSPIEFALQSAVDTILFITEKGSRYSIEFEPDDVFPDSLKKEIQNISLIHSLRYTDIGKKILES